MILATTFSKNSHFYQHFGHKLRKNLATLRLLMKCTWSRSRGTRLALTGARLAFSACLQIRYDCTVILTVSVLSSVSEV